MKKETSEGTQDSKTNLSTNEEYEDDVEEEEDVDQDNIPNSRASSSNSTVEENEKKAASASGSSVRQYIRSKNPRLRWTPDLHLHFINAIERLGGQERATPKLVLQLMNIKGLNISHVKSHLQMYRSKKLDNPNQVSDQGFVSDHGGDHHIYNLSQLPMLKGFNQRPNIPSLRFGDDHIWSRHRANPTYSPFYGSQVERILNIKNYNSNSYNYTANKSPYESWQSQIRRTTMEANLVNELKEREKDQETNTSAKFLQRSTSTKVNEEERIAPKRKYLGSDLSLDLNLSLKMTRNDNGLERKDKASEIGSSLSLSLFTNSNRIEDAKGSKKHARVESTLDLTL